ncbi:helix-turn-helix transcriptional regulator [Paenibacillus sp. Marseille-Q4541]|uniref:helix-turn-helix transcriptional regulator n=1 Tax=Paenibacillus sp. Marseille-Q4541 TaxID=2831522 RepID=UPI001BAADFA4|nr:helix-turn-helix transcriptional regulator [Paenibacillus sp. Marseille-Q4541]
MTTHHQHRRTIREWRAYRKLTKTKIADSMKVCISTYTRMENRPESVSMQEASELADVFECRVRDIVFFENNPNLLLDIFQEAH